MMVDETTLKAAHKHCIRHRDEVLASEICGCFYCLRTYSPDGIKEWADTGQTAICPECGIDSVLGDETGYPVASSEFLKAMHVYWFERTVYAEH